MTINERRREAGLPEINMRAADEIFKDVELKKCALRDCNGEVKFHTESMTSVGYSSPLGHNHDDNCRKAYYSCSNGHKWTERWQNICNVKDCEWKGKLECFCHPLGVKVIPKDSKYYDDWMFTFKPKGRK